MGKTSPGTRCYHHNKPISTFEICFKRTSEHDFIDRFDLPKVAAIAAPDVVAMPNLKDSIAYRYNLFWWVSMVDEIDITTMTSS